MTVGFQSEAGRGGRARHDPTLEIPCKDNKRGDGVAQSVERRAPDSTTTRVRPEGRPGDFSDSSPLLGISGLPV